MSTDNDEERSIDDYWKVPSCINEVLKGQSTNFKHEKQYSILLRKIRNQHFDNHSNDLLRLTNMQAYQLKY